MKEKRKVTVDEEEFEVLMERKDNFWIVEVEGVSFNVKIDGDLSDSKESRRRTGSKRKVSGKISSSIPGKIVSLNVTLEDIVEQGQVIMILEAMKMQHECLAAVAGEVLSVAAQAGQQVAAGDLILMIDADDAEAATE